MSRSPLLCMAFALICAVGWIAQPEARGAETEDAEPILATAPVVIDGVELFEVRGVPALSADQRAGRIAGRIRAFAADAGLPADGVRLVPEDQLTSIYAGNRMLVRVSDADAHAEGLNRETLARFYRERIIDAAKAYRAERHAGALLQAAFHALLATGVLILLLLGQRRAFRRLESLLQERLRGRIRDVRLQSFQLVTAAQLLAGLHRVLRGMQLLLWLVLLFAYLDLVLRMFPWTRGLGARLFDIVFDPVRAMGAALLESIPDLVFLVILYYAVRYALKLLHLVFEGLADERIVSTSFDREWAWPTYRIVRILVVAFAVVVAYPYIPGSETAAFKSVSLFIGVVLSLGSTSAIANVIAGYTLSYRRAFRTGDRVRIGEHVGDVVEQRVLVTYLRTPKNEEVIVPNSVILNTEVINYSTAARDRSLILHTRIGIGYETPWRQVEALLLEAAVRTKGLLAEPPPFVLQAALGDFAVTYELNAWCDDAQAMEQLYSSLHRSILDVFNEYGVQIMTPAYESDPAEPKIVPRDQWYAPPASPAVPPQGGSRA